MSASVGGKLLAFGCWYPPLDLRGCSSAQHHIDLLMNFVSVRTSMMSISRSPCFWNAPVQVQRWACVCKSWKVYTTSVHSLAGTGGGLCCGSSSSAYGISWMVSEKRLLGAGAASVLWTRGCSICCTRLWVISSPCGCCIASVRERIFGDGKGGEVEADGG